MVNLNSLTQYLNTLLKTSQFTDYGPNGLQIEGTQEIKSVCFAVSATRASVEETVKRKAQALIVHHGLFWKFHGVRTLTGPFAQRVFPLVRHHISLLGYHLPLDAHMEFGNAVSLGHLIPLSHMKPFGDHKGMPTGVKGTLVNPLPAHELKKQLELILHHSVLMSSPRPSEIIHSLGIITGGANSQWTFAYDEGLDAYLTGEMSEHDWHESQESDIHMFAGGHHATETFGIQKLMDHLSDKFSLECHYIPSDNPA